MYYTVSSKMYVKTTICSTQHGPLASVSHRGESPNNTDAFRGDPLFLRAKFGIQVADLYMESMIQKSYVTSNLGPSLQWAG